MRPGFFLRHVHQLRQRHKDPGGMGDDLYHALLPHLVAMPFLTEEIWQALPKAEGIGEGDFLMLQKWPEPQTELSFPEEEKAIDTWAGAFPTKLGLPRRASKPASSFFLCPSSFSSRFFSSAI